MQLKSQRGANNLLSHCLLVQIVYISLFFSICVDRFYMFFTYFTFILYEQVMVMTYLNSNGDAIYKHVMVMQIPFLLLPRAA